MPSRSHTALLSVALLLFTACGDDGFSPQVIEDVDFAASLQIDLADFTRLAGGVYVHDQTVGDGQTVQTSDEVTVGYTGWLADGTQFDSGSFEFTFGVGEVIPGFDQGVAGMRVGGERRMVIPPALGYGDSGSGPIPGGAVLVFRVQVLSLTRP